MSINNNTSTKDNFGTSKQTRNSSFYLKNRNNNPIIKKDVSTTANKTNIVYNTKNDRKITTTSIEMVTSDKSYNNQTLKSNLDLHSREHDDNVTRKSADTITTKDKGAVFTNFEYERMIFPRGEKESDEENEKYVIEEEVVIEKREDKNNSKMTSSTKSICTYKIQTDIVKKKMIKSKRSKETITSNGNIWKKMEKERNAREN